MERYMRSFALYTHSLRDLYLDTRPRSWPQQPFPSWTTSSQVSEYYHWPLCESPPRRTNYNREKRRKSRFEYSSQRYGFYFTLGYSPSYPPSWAENPQVSLHGGPEGFDTRDWQPIDLADATLFSESEKRSIASLPSSVIFRLVSPDGDQGFPGNLLLEVLYALSSPVSKQGSHSEKCHVGSLYIVYRAKLFSDKNSEVTPVNLTQVTLLSFASLICSCGAYRDVL